MTSLVEMGMIYEGQVRGTCDKPCGEGKGLTEEGLVRRLGDKPCRDGKGLTEERTCLEIR